LARRILDSVSEPIPAGGQQCSVGVSIGIAVSPPQDFDKLALIRKADAAMYEAKNTSGNSYRFGDS
jgi:GGDEF domain-containing protein